MQGYMFIQRAGMTAMEMTKLSNPPGLARLQEIVGGYIQHVPNFSSINTGRSDGERARCFAYCDEEGKLKNKPPNFTATALWDSAMQTAGMPSLLDNSGNFADVLVGDVVILIGDRAFMQAL